MCTDQCPCAYNLNLTKFDEPRLTDYNRTKSNVALSVNSNLVKLVLAKNSTTLQYGNFFKCYQDNKGNMTSSATANRVIVKLTDGL